MALFEDESECRLLFQLDYTSPLTPEFDPSDRPISDIFGKHLLLLGLSVQICHSDSRRQAAAHSSWVSAPSGPRSTWSPRLRYTFIRCIVNMMISSNYSLGQREWMIVWISWEIGRLLTLILSCAISHMCRNAAAHVMLSSWYGRWCAGSADKNSFSWVFL